MEIVTPVLKGDMRIGNNIWNRPNKDLGLLEVPDEWALWQQR